MNVQPKPAATTQNHESLLGGVHEKRHFLSKEVVDEAHVVKHGAVVSKMPSLAVSYTHLTLPTIYSV